MPAPQAAPCAASKHLPDGFSGGGAVGEGGEVKAPYNRFSAFCDAGAGNPVCCRAENGRIFGAKNTYLYNLKL
jgi:hypothetical protein